MERFLKLLLQISMVFGVPADAWGPLSYLLDPYVVEGHITIPGSTQDYPYLLGDDISLYKPGGTMHGISVHLPKSFPHIYLDSQRGGRYTGKRCR